MNDLQGTLSAAERDLMGFDLEAELAAITNTQNIARRLGANMLAQRVQAWATKHHSTLSKEQISELMAILTEDA